METKPNSFLVGIIVLIILVAGAGFIIWFSKLEIGNDHHLYQIDFDGAVTGLRENEDVLYKGISVGKVKKIRVFKDDVNRVKVIVDIKRPDIIRESSIATIEAQGLTGYTFVQIQNSEQDSPVLIAREGQKHPIIHSKKSSIETLFASAPELITHLSNLALKIDKFFDDDLVQDTKVAMTHLKTLMAQLSEGEQSLPTIMRDVRTSLHSLTKASHSFAYLIKQNEPALSLFIETGLPAMTTMMQKIDHAADHVSDLTKMIQRGPIDLLKQSPHQGYKVK